VSPATSTSQATDAASAINTSTTNSTFNKKFNEDTAITSPRLRAEAGSLSTYSIKSSMIYLGPGIGHMDSRDRPNPDHMVGSYATSLGGSISGRYRISSDAALSFGTGLTALHPIQGTDRIDTRTPFIGYDLTKRFSEIQTRQAFEINKTTVPEQLRVGQVGGLSYGSSILYDLGMSKYSVGFDSRLNYSNYNRGYEAPNRRMHIHGDGNASNYLLSFSPNFLYNFSDRVSANTAFPLTYQNMRSSKSIYQLRTLELTQSLGMSYSFSPQVMVSPFINLYPAHASTETTTFNVATIFSVL
jgi:hypothetical protein